MCSSITIGLEPRIDHRVLAERIDQRSHDEREFRSRPRAPARPRRGSCRPRIPTSCTSRQFSEAASCLTQPDLPAGPRRLRHRPPPPAGFQPPDPDQAGTRLWICSRRLLDRARLHEHHDVLLAHASAPWRFREPPTRSMPCSAAMRWTTGGYLRLPLRPRGRRVGMMISFGGRGAAGSPSGVGGSGLEAPAAPPSRPFSSHATAAGRRSAPAPPPRRRSPRSAPGSRSRRRSPARAPRCRSCRRDLADRLLGLDPVAGLDAPGDDRALGDRDAHLGHRHVDQDVSRRGARGTPPSRGRPRAGRPPRAGARTGSARRASPPGRPARPGLEPLLGDQRRHLGARRAGHVRLVDDHHL